MSATKQPVRVTLDMLAGVMLGDMTDHNLGRILGPQWAPARVPKSVVKPTKAPLRTPVRTKSVAIAGKTYRA